jgi:ABC-type Na+ transport system ATPase subunit NatA
VPVNLVTAILTQECARLIPTTQISPPPAQTQTAKPVTSKNQNVSIAKATIHFMRILVFPATQNFTQPVESVLVSVMKIIPDSMTQTVHAQQSIMIFSPTK